MRAKILSFSLLFLVLMISSFVSVRAISNALPGNINGDGIVNMKDVAVVARAFGSRPGDPNWNPIADIDGDGIVDQTDLSIVVGNFGGMISPLFLNIITNPDVGADVITNVTAQTKYADNCTFQYRWRIDPAFADYYNYTYTNWTNWESVDMDKSGNVFTALDPMSCVYLATVEWRLIASNNFGYSSETMIFDFMFVSD